ncbi:hypothetical protein UPYG_G00002870 [Umbra pygmaea]|uniref:Uncharacterized protein n=1 Tax=Umbra pygmaea TaxID=75934 RepID=A0ABD0XGS0_UMBPY
MEENFADLLTDAFSETSLLSFPEGEFDFEPLNFEEDQTDITSPSRLSVLREEEENVTEGDEWERTGCETGSVSEHIPLETYVNLNKEDIQHIREEEEEEEEEQTEEGDEEEEEESGGQTGKIHEDISMETYDVCLNDKEDEEKRSEDKEEDEEEEMGSQKDEDVRVESTSSPRDWSIVTNDDDHSCDGDEDSENNDVRCFEGFTGDGTLEITEGQKAEDHSTEDEYESSDSDLEVLTSSTTENQTEDVMKMDSLSHHVLQEDEEEKGGRATNVCFDCTGHAAALNVQSPMEHTLEDKIKVFLPDDHQGVHKSFSDFPPDFSEHGHDKDARKGATERNKEGSMIPRPSGPNVKTKGNVNSGQRMMEEQVSQQERQGDEDGPQEEDEDGPQEEDEDGPQEEDEDGPQEEDEDGEEPTAALSLSANTNQVFADCAVCKSDIDTSMGRVGVVHLEPGSSSESYSDSSSDGSDDNSSEDENVNPKEPNKGALAGPQYQVPPRSDLESKFSPPQNLWKAEGKDTSKQSLASLPPPENISDVTTLTPHSEPQPCRAALNISEGTGNTPSSDSEKRLLCTLSEDKQETWLQDEAGPDPSEDHYQPEVQLDVAWRLESPTHTNVRWDTGDNTVDIIGSQEDGYEVFDRGEEEFEDEEDEHDRNWEEEKVRIDAFYKFYNDKGGEEEVAIGTDYLLPRKKPRVQFCLEPFPQVIEYTDSSDMDISTDGEMDLDSTDRLEEENDPGSLRKNPEQKKLVFDSAEDHLEDDRCDLDGTGNVLVDNRPDGQ